MGSPPNSDPRTDGQVVLIVRPARGPMFSTKSASIPIGLGLVLLAAGGLKGYELATGPVAETDFWSSRPLRVGAVELELALGVWLLSGYRPRPARWAALVGFTAFSSFSLARALNGDTSCGCFGRVLMNPWYTLGLDVAAITALAGWRPVPVLPKDCLQPRHYKTVLLVFLVASLPLGIASVKFRPMNADEKGSLVLLEPDQWIGQGFPLQKQIDIGDELMQGRWIVVLHRHDCPRCRAAVTHWEHMAQTMAYDSDAPGIALIEVSPGGEGTSLPLNHMIMRGLLRNEQNWFVATPAVVYLADGVVQAAPAGEGWVRDYQEKHAVLSNGPRIAP